MSKRFDDRRPECNGDKAPAVVVSVDAKRIVQCIGRDHKAVMSKSSK